MNFRDTSVLLCCIGCWETFPDSEEGDGAMMGHQVRCCDRTYEAFFSVRSGPEEFRTGFRLIADQDGPVPEEG